MAATKPTEEDWAGQEPRLARGLVYHRNFVYNAILTLIIYI